MKKRKKKIDNYSIIKSIRKTWGFNPKTRVKGNDKVYNRNRAKREFRKMINEDVEV